MLSYWGVHSSYMWWLDINFWNCQSVVFTCYHIFGQRIRVTIPQPRIDEYKRHHLSLVLVQSFHQGNTSRTFSLIKGSILFCKPIIWLWSTLAFNNMLQHRLLKYFALVELFIAMILSNIEDEHCFSTLSFLKFKLCNQLIK